MVGGRNVAVENVKLTFYHSLPILIIDGVGNTAFPGGLITTLISVRGSGHPGTFYTSSCPTVTKDFNKTKILRCAVSTRAATVTGAVTTTGTAGSVTSKNELLTASKDSEMTTAVTVVPSVKYGAPPVSSVGSTPVGTPVLITLMVDS